METEALTAASEIDFSVLALYLRATFTVKIVMLMLIFSSIWSWSIIIQKFINYRKARKNAYLFESFIVWFTVGRVRPNQRAGSGCPAA